MKTVCVFVGSRANYSSCRSIMRAVADHPALALQTVLSGAAVLDRYGNIADLVAADGFRIDARFHMVVEGETPATMAQSTGLGIIEVTQVLDALRPEVVLVVGDRFDVLAPAVAAAFMNIPLAHTMGGEVSGTIDESIRHAITKLAHLHFPANDEARRRILAMGEDPSRVHTVGCPRIDLVREVVAGNAGCDRIDGRDFFARHKGVGGAFDLERGRFLLVSQHPVTTEYGRNRRNIEETLAALERLRRPTVMLWPNLDAGSDEVSKGIRTFRERRRPEWLHVFINLPAVAYIRLLDMCACVVGNSSSAIREGAFIGTPAVNIGTRQQGRLRGANVVDAGYDRDAIAAAVEERCAAGRRPPAFIYGRGDAGRRIAEILAATGRVEVQKRFRDPDPPPRAGTP